MMRSLSILLCGYGWFAGIPEGETNNAERIARALDGEILARGDARADGRADFRAGRRAAGDAEHDWDVSVQLHDVSSR